MNGAYFSSSFRKYTGSSFINYLTEIGIKKAKVLLEDKDKKYVKYPRNVYLPTGRQWYETSDGKCFNGGCSYEIFAPIDHIPVFTDDKALLSLFQQT